MTSLAFNRDCMEAMREFPDKFFDLAVVDPPYGDGCSQTVNVERERERAEAHGITDSAVKEAFSKNTSVSRTGGKWAAKYGKK